VHLLHVAGKKHISDLTAEGELCAFLSQLNANIIYFAENPAECRLDLRLKTNHDNPAHPNKTGVSQLPQRT